MSYVIYVLPTQCQHSVTIFHIGPHITSEMRMCVCLSQESKHIIIIIIIILSSKPQSAEAGRLGLVPLFK